MASRPLLGPVLLVEDDEQLAYVVARHLRARQYAVEVAASAEEAGRLLASGLRPTIVLLDINLPDESGWGFLRSGRLATAGSPPVYIVSATTVSASRLHEFGVAGYLPKPFALPTLMGIVERHGGTGADSHTQADGVEESDAR
jgi:DNA-binding response OmpR family regulator